MNKIVLLAAERRVPAKTGPAGDLPALHYASAQMFADLCCVLQA